MVHPSPPYRRCQGGHRNEAGASRDVEAPDGHGKAPRQQRRQLESSIVLEDGHQLLQLGPVVIGCDEGYAQTNPVQLVRDRSLDRLPARRAGAPSGSATHGTERTEEEMSSSHEESGHISHCGQWSTAFPTSSHPARAIALGLTRDRSRPAVRLPVASNACWHRVATPHHLLND